MAGDESGRAIASIYSALLGEVSWQDVVGEIAALTQAEMATMFYHDAVSGRGAITLASGISEAIQRDYASYFAPLNPWMARIEDAPVGEAIVGERIVSRESFRRSEYYNDFLHLHDQESGIGVTVRRDDGCFFLFSLLTGDTDLERNEERARTLTRLTPHLRKVADFYRRQASAASGIADEFGVTRGVATVVVNDAARVVHASMLGGERLAEGDPLGVDAAGVVSFGDPLAQSVFEHSLGRNHADLLVKTLPVGRSEVTFLRLMREDGPSIFMGGTLAILIAPRSHGATAAVSEIAARHRLTPAEARVLGAIVAGRRPAEIATAARTSVETVRSQLKAIYAKTGTGRQADLVRLVTGLVDGNGDVHSAPRRS